MEKLLTIVEHHGGHSRWWENFKHLRWKGTRSGILTLLLIFRPLCWSNNERVRKIIWKGKGKKRAWRQKNMSPHKGQERGLSENKRTCIKRKRDPSILQNLERNLCKTFTAQMQVLPIRRIPHSAFRLQPIISRWGLASLVIQLMTAYSRVLEIPIESHLFTSLDSRTT